MSSHRANGTHTNTDSQNENSCSNRRTFIARAAHLAPFLTIDVHPLRLLVDAHLPSLTSLLATCSTPKSFILPPGCKGNCRAQRTHEKTMTESRSTLLSLSKIRTWPPLCTRPSASDRLSRQVFSVNYSTFTGPFLFLPQKPR